MISAGRSFVICDARSAGTSPAIKSRRKLSAPGLTAVLLIALAPGSLSAADDSTFRVPFEKYKLSNGLRVVLSRDPTVPLVSVYVIYGVGTRSEQKGTTGFAQLTSQMMFEGSANVAKSGYLKSIRSAGGAAGSSTHPDYTDFFETTPSNKLGLALWLESDRMGGLILTAENLKAQRDAIKPARRPGLDSDVYDASILEKWPALIFENLRNSHSSLVTPEDLQAATVSSISEFHQTYFAPNNAVLVVAGDFETAQAKKMVEQCFGSLPSRPQPPVSDISEPERAVGKSSTYMETHAPLPAVLIGWPAPKRHSREFYSLEMLDSLLTSGKTSRIQNRLMKDRQSVIQYESNVGWPFGNFRDFRDPGEYAALAIYRTNFSPQQIISQVQQEIDLIAELGIGDRELQRAKAVFRFQEISKLQSSLERARSLGQYELLDGDPGMLSQDLVNVSAVTATQVRDLARVYLTAARRDTLAIQPGQDPYVIAGDHYHLALENDWVRASRVNYGPHESTPLHEHPSTTSVIFIYDTDGGKIRFTHFTPNRVILIRPDVKAGEIRLAHSAPGETHTAEYLGDTPMEYIRLELRTETPDPPIVNHKIPAPVIDSSKSAVVNEFENGQFRILRVICAAGEKCPESKNPRDPAVVTVMSGANRGTVSWSPATETGPLDEVRVELKTRPLPAENDLASPK